MSVLVIMALHNLSTNFEIQKTWQNHIHAAVPPAVLNNRGQIPYVVLLYTPSFRLYIAEALSIFSRDLFSKQSISTRQSDLEQTAQLSCTKKKSTIFSNFQSSFSTQRYPSWQLKCNSTQTIGLPCNYHYTYKIFVR